MTTLSHGINNDSNDNIDGTKTIYLSSSNSANRCMVNIATNGKKPSLFTNSNTSLDADAILTSETNRSTSADHCTINSSDNKDMNFFRLSADEL